MSNQIEITDQMFAMAATAIIRDKFDELPAEWFLALMSGFNELNQAVHVNDVVAELLNQPGSLEEAEREYMNLCATLMFQDDRELKAQLENNFPSWYTLFFLAQWCVDCIQNRPSNDQNVDIQISSSSLLSLFSVIEDQMRQSGLL